MSRSKLGAIPIMWDQRWPDEMFANLPGRDQRSGRYDPGEVVTVSTPLSSRQPGLTTACSPIGAGPRTLPKLGERDGYAKKAHNLSERLTQAVVLQSANGF